MTESRISSDPFYSLPTRGKVRRVGSPWETRLGGRGEETELRLAAGWRRTNRMLQTHRGSAAAAPAPAPAPGEMLMGFCRIWRVIGRREFGATSSSRCHWLGAICCSLSREPLAPPPLSFSFSASLPRAPGPVPGIPRPRRRSGAFPPRAGEDRGREWGAGGSHPPGTAPPTRRPDGPGGSLPGNSGEALGPSTSRGSLPPSRSQRRVGGQTSLRNRGPEPRGPPGSRLAPQRARGRGPLRNNGPAALTGALAARGSRGPRAGDRHTHAHPRVCARVWTCTRARRCATGRAQQGTVTARHRAAGGWDPIPMPTRPGRVREVLGTVQRASCHLGIAFQEKGRKRRHVLSHGRRPED